MEQKTDVTGKTSQTQIWFGEKINKVDKLLAIVIIKMRKDTCQDVE
jgi:hypothetical protein